jgi:hypothetical protein
VNVKMGSNKEGIISPKCEQKIPSSSLHTDDYSCGNTHTHKKKKLKNSALSASMDQQY